MTYKSMTSPSARKMSAYNIVTISFPAMLLVENKEELGLIQKGIYKLFLAAKHFSTKRHSIE
uniref:Putative ovule protein n=1 Tax=Solanum chacoense TaxID=4108 RepID=A0A0V0GZX9_SOLCH